MGTRSRSDLNVLISFHF